MKYKIVGDSCCDFTAEDLKKEYISRVPLILTVGDTDVIDDDMDLYEVFRDREREFYDVIIVDEAQFLQPAHVEQLREIVDYYNVPVFCFGLRTDFRTRLFPGSARLFELADSVTELKTVCTCGGKAMVNARIDAEGRVVTEGEQFLLGGNESYRPMCYKCWKKAALESKSEK